MNNTLWSPRGARAGERNRATGYTDIHIFMSLGVFSKYAKSLFASFPSHATVPLYPQMLLVSPLGDLNSSKQNFSLAIILKNRGIISNSPSVCLSQLMFSDFLLRFNVHLEVIHVKN
jgi:hypothetical protein